MTSGEQLDGDPASILAFYIGNTEESRISLASGPDENYPPLEFLIGLAGKIASILSEAHRFLEIQSRPPDSNNIRRYMMEEMDSLWKVRARLLDDLDLFTNGSVRYHLSQMNAGEEVIDACLNELESIRETTITDLGEKVSAAWDDISDKEVAALTRQKSRKAARDTLRDLAQSWASVSDMLLTAKEIWSSAPPGGEAARRVT
jgi:hypothetical protein